MKIKGKEYEKFRTKDDITTFIREVDKEVRGRKNANSTLKESYNGKNIECGELLGSIRTKLRENRQEFNKTNAWGNLSDLQEVSKMLQEILDYVS